MSASPKPVVVGTAGHVDHGKTVLVRALTGVDTDRWEEEKRRGITIDLGFAPFPSTPDLSVSVIDVPGHEDFVRNMLAGATGIDLVLLVVAADEGPMPQTREHLAIVSLLGIRRGVIAVTKADLVEPDWLALALDAARQEVRTVVGADWPAAAVSATTGQGVDGLREAVLEAARGVPERPADDLFRMPVDRSFTIKGAGTVVTGTVWSGAVTRDSECLVLPAGRRARVRGIHVHGSEAARARAGRRAALALAGLDRDEVARGDTLVADAAWRATSTLEAEVSVLPFAARPLRSHQRVRVHLGTAEVMGRVVLLEGRECGPGRTALAQLRLEAPLVARGGDPFVLRFYSPVTTIGGGRVLYPWARRRGTVRAEEAAVLRGLEAAAPEARLAALVDLARWNGVAPQEAAVAAGLRPAAALAALETLAAAGRIAEAAGRWFSADRLVEAERRLVGAVDAFHETHPAERGIPLESLRAEVPGRCGPGLAQTVLRRLEDAGRILLREGVAARAGFAPGLDPERAALGERVAERLRDAGLAPPDAAELARELGANVLPILKFLARQGRAVAVTPDLYFDPEALDAARRRVEGFLAEHAPAGPSDLKSALGVSRKYLIPILEWLDREGITLRTSEGRKLRAGTSVSR